ncbi:MAG: MBL fold metallo-hydrolase [Nannocystales bacterium]
METPDIEFHPNVATNIDQLSTSMSVPGMGTMVTNAFVLRATEPMLVDAGITAYGDAMIERLSSVLDLESLRWIYITHADNDHVGPLHELLMRAPLARVVTTYMGMAKLSQVQPIAPQRVFLLNPGQTLELGDRQVTAVAPPVYDAPETTMLWDPVSRALFSSDCFGGLVLEPVERASSVPADALRDGMLTWLMAESPWVRSVDPAAMDQALRRVSELRPQTVLSAHLAPAPDMLDVLLDTLRLGRGAPPFVGPDQAAFASAP